MRPGVCFESKEAVVQLWAPLAQKAGLLLEDGAYLPLEKGDRGYWHLRTTALQPGSRYRFSIDGQNPLPDPASLSQPDGVHAASEAIDVQRFQWQDAQWHNLPLEDYIIYELHTGTFSPGGNFEGIERKLDYLKELGITAIEIMPVAQFPGSRNWGYDGVFPYAVQNSFGGPEGLARLVDACHQKGLSVILDVVYNHLGPEGNYLGAYGPYFTDKYKTPWGSAINFDDAWCDGVRDFFIENALMWFRDFHIDALRLDAVHAIKDFSARHVLQELHERLAMLMQETGRRHYLIVESDLNDVRFINPKEKGGYGMDAQWVDEFHHALRVAAGEARQGYYRDFEGIGHLAKSYQDAYVYDGIYSPHRHKTFGSKTTGQPGNKFIVFSQNHDQVGNRMLGERSSQLYAFEMQKLLAAAVMLSPFLPLLFMGEEYAESHPFLYFVSHTDPDLVAAVRKGRSDEFKEFHAAGEAPDPQSEETFQQSKLQWDLLEKEPHQTMLRYYKALLALRKSNPALKDPNRAHLAVAVNKAQQWLMLIRKNKDQYLSCWLNFSKSAAEIKVPHDGKKLFDSASPDWKGPVAAAENAVEGSTILLQPASILIYQHHV